MICVCERGVDKVTFIRIPEVTTRITALVNGEVDIVSEIPPDQYALIDNEAGLKRVEVTYPMYHVYLSTTPTQ